MKTPTQSRLTPLCLNKAHTLLNRIVVPPMASGTATTQGFATQQTLDHYANLRESGAGLIIAEYTFVHASGRSEQNQLGISTDNHIEGLSEIAKILKMNGATAGIQLSHGGGKSSKELTNGRLMSPSGIPVPVKDQILETPNPMNFDELELWKNAFVEAARRAVAAGFDLVELHSAHGYGLNQWLSPITISVLMNMDKISKVDLGL